MARSRLHELSEHGVSVWVDSLSREMLETGELDAAHRRGRRRRRDLESDDLREGALDRRLVRRAASRRARALRRHEGGLLRARGRGHQARVRSPASGVGADRAASTGSSRSRSTPISRTSATRRSSRRSCLTELVDRPNLFVKIPATVPGLGAIEDSIAGRALDQRDAHLLARAATRPSPRRTSAGSSGSSRRAAIRPTSRRSRASSSRASTPRPTAASPRSAARICRDGSPSTTRSSRTSTTSRSSPGARWDALAAAGARPQRCLWASTSTKNPAYRDVLYVEELIGPDTVNTMPFETIAAFQDHGVCARDAHRGRRRGAGAARRARRRRRRLRRRHGHARARRRPEVLGLVRLAARGHRREARRPRVAERAADPRQAARSATVSGSSCPSGCRP